MPVNPDDKPRPVGQLRVDADKDRLIKRGAKHGWVVLSHEPLILRQPELDKQIEVGYNHAGLLNGLSWTRGDEFTSMQGGGHVNLSQALDEWFSWRPENK